MLTRWWPRSKLQCTLSSLALCAITCYTFVWNNEIIPSGSAGRRRLAFLDNSPVPAQSQFTALVHPGSIDSRHVPMYDGDDNDPERDSLCDDVFLFMTSGFDRNGHGSRLNNYLLAALVATYTNKAMVILEPPQEFIQFEGGSQFGCPKEDVLGVGGDTTTLPNGLSRLVKHPDWLSRKCPVPCQGVYDFGDWEKMRHESKPVTCKSDNGRLTNVVAMNGWETRDYFDKNLKDRMLHRIPLQAKASYDWAKRLGAKDQEALQFSLLDGRDDIWDYVSALIARTALLRFQPWIVRDVEEYIRRSYLPLDSSYDAIHVRRGDKLAVESKQFVEEYWTSRGYRYPEPEPNTILHPKELAPTNYIPLKHYLSQYDKMECNSEARLVYIATDDPKEVQREINDLPKDEEGSTTMNDGCHKFKFIFSPATEELREFHVNTDNPEDGCEGRYARTIASIADLMTLAKSDTFIGEFNSNWGRLIRIFRLQLRSDDEKTGKDGSPLFVARNMRVAWGNKVSFAPGM
ncbi:hypothetical protein ACHAXR_005389 [Thalassiosira sp. AJA248-18]